MEITFCCGLPEDDVEARELLTLYRRMGATSVQSYVKWNCIEPRHGEFDWRFYDREVRLLQEFGLKWVPFIILGPWYITPQWFQDSADSHFTKCLEHQRESRVQSIWNSDLPAHVERVMKAFADHYLGARVLESVLLGISGDYGEAIYQAVGNWPLDYHTHRGYWCGDDSAVADYRRWLQDRFGTIDELNRRWSSAYESWDIVPCTHENAPSARAWLDQMKWYRDAMTAWAGRWMDIAKAAFPGVELYLCTGGDGMPQHGSDFSAQCKLAAACGAGVRITNEGSDYLFNFIITRLVAAASRHYGAFFGFEPASTIDERGIVARIYNVAASGARQLHEYAENFYDFEKREAKPAVLKGYEDNATFLKDGTPRVAVAVFLPVSDFTCHDVGFSSRLIAGARWIRDIVDFDFVDEHLIVDDALSHYRYLIVLDGEIADEEALEALDRWVRHGGVLISWRMLKTIDGDDSVSCRLFGLTDQGEELTGIQGLRLVEPAFLEHFGAAPHPITAHSFRGFAETARPLAVLEKDKASAVWLNRHGEGYAIYFAGPVEQDVDLSFTWMGDQHLYLQLIRDCLFNLSRVCIGWQDLPRLDDAPDQVYVTDMGDQLLCLNYSDRPVQKETPAGLVEIPPYSIRSIAYSR
jgi:hypothetical protein